MRAATTVALCLSVVLFAPCGCRDLARRGGGRALDRALERARARLLRPPHRRLQPLGREPRVSDRARASRPCSCWSAPRSRGDARRLAALGVVTVGAGVVLVRGLRGPVDTRGVVTAIAIAATIAGYTLADKEGIEHASPVAYLELVLVPVALAALAWQLASAGRESVRSAIGAEPSPRRSSRSGPTRSSSGRSRWRRPRPWRRSARRASCSRSRSAPTSSGSPSARCASREPRSSSPASPWSRSARRGGPGSGAILRAPHFTGFTKWARCAHSF